jgi:hypothetical protein
MTTKHAASKIIGTKKVGVDTVDPFKFGNPRAMTPAMREVLRKSIDELGYLQPVMVRAVGTGRKTRYEILDGHHRYDDIKARGQTEIEVLIVDVPSDADARKLALSLNRIGADWDPEKLSEYVEKMLSEGIATTEDILSTTGFASDELEQLAREGTSFLDSFIKQNTPPDEPDEPSETGGGKGSGAAAPDTQASGDRVKINFVATPSQHAAIYDAIKIVRKKDPDLTAIQALANVCASYTESVSKRH